MSARRLTTAALAVAALGVAPAAAVAQSGGAGDNQYVDPFGSNSQQPHKQSNGSGGSQGSSGTSTGPALSSTPTLSASSTPTATAASSSAQTLPRTGVDARIVAALGLVLLLAGAALRLRLRDERL